MRTLLISIGALLLTKFFLVAAHPIPQTSTPIQVLQSPTHDGSFVGEIDVLQHREAAGLTTLVPDNNDLEARTEPPVWQDTPIEIPKVFVPPSVGNLKLYLNVPYPNNEPGVSSIFSLMKSMETAMGDLAIRQIVSQFQTTLMTNYKLTDLPIVGQEVMDPLSSSDFDFLRYYIDWAVASHNEGNWLENSIPRDVGGHWLIPNILTSQGWRAPSQHGPTHAQLPGADVPPTPYSMPGTSSHHPAVHQGSHVPPMSIPCPGFPSQSTLLWKKAGSIWVPPNFLPDNMEVGMNVPVEPNPDAYHSMVKLLELFGSVGGKRKGQQLSYIVDALKKISKFDQLSLNELKCQSFPETDLLDLKYRIKESLDEYNGKFDNWVQPGPPHIVDSDAARLAPPQRGPTHAQLPGPYVPIAPGTPPSSHQINQFHVPPGQHGPARIGQWLAPTGHSAVPTYQYNSHLAPSPYAMPGISELPSHALIPNNHGTLGPAFPSSLGSAVPYGSYGYVNPTISGASLTYPQLLNTAIQGNNQYRPAIPPIPLPGPHFNTVAPKMSFIVEPRRNLQVFVRNAGSEHGCFGQGVH